MMSPKKQDFWPRNNVLKGFFFQKSVDELPSKSAKIVPSKSIFDVKNQLIFFKKISFKNINLGDQFLVKTFFLDSIFEPLYLLKLCPTFDKLTFLLGIF